MMADRENELRIGVYVGEGASHSWTWFVDLLEKSAFRRLSFLDEENFGARTPEQDVLLLSGGDTFGVARALGPAGAASLRGFVEGGGLYIGSCAGAYLPLYSSKEALRDFNFVKSRINNLARDLPPVRRLPAKFSSAYGCVYVIHPVREEVRVRLTADFPVWGGREIRLPLYGGPPLEASEDVDPKAYYTGFTERTVFLTDPEIAERVYLGKAAACEKRIGAGRMVLLGPHFEHPGFPEGNDVVRCWIESQGAGAAGRDRRPAGGPEKSRAGPSRAWLEAFRKEVSNMRIRAHALARESVSWRIGEKVYEPEKAAYFLETIWKRLKGLRPAMGFSDGQAEEALLARASICHGRLRELSERIESGLDSQAAAEETFGSLRKLAAGFLEYFFQRGRCI